MGERGDQQEAGAGAKVVCVRGDIWRERPETCLRRPFGKRWTASIRAANVVNTRHNDGYCVNHPSR